MSEETSEPITLRLPKDAAQWLALVEKASGLSRTAIIRLAIAEFRANHHRGDEISLSFEIPAPKELMVAEDPPPRPKKTG